MHLDHKLPWKTIASHFTLAKSETNANYNLKALGLPTQDAALGHFSRVFIATIEEFSNTETSKINPDQINGKLFSDDVLNFPEHHFDLGPHEENSALKNPLHAKHQDLNYWKKRATTSESDTGYCTRDGDLADAAKMLVITAAVSDNKTIRREALSALYQLSTHVPMSDLRYLTWGHGFGLDLVTSEAMKLYVLLNLIEAVQSQGAQQVSLLRVEILLRVLGNYALQNYDFPAQNIPHRAFWNSLGITEVWADRQADGIIESQEEEPVVDPLGFGDDEVHQKARVDLKRYLKDCFAILYVYDVFLKQVTDEEVRKEFWTYEIKRAVLGL
ncbi:hypothetical protein FPOAC2_07253 [Fusarium poae]|jgi:hypothetical protein|uniref:hypothetical protein n=1 Tax=Fusarium poae TaxID=36050 RepID=UPI001CE76A10|nr:hypothetical protein FPOAC1_007100 [Fusarium poae]KAG8673781.1 hypothetical protein FPOAC1_007100 [Fusarium poae]